MAQNPEKRQVSFNILATDYSALNFQDDTISLYTKAFAAAPG
jgi:hypothetical protein